MKQHYDADKQDVEIHRVFLSQKNQQIRFDCQYKKSGDRVVVDFPKSKCNQLLFDYLENFAGSAEQKKLFEATESPAAFDRSLRSDSEELAISVAEFSYWFDTYWIQLVCKTTDGTEMAPISFAGDWKLQFLLAIA